MGTEVNNPGRRPSVAELSNIYQKTNEDWSHKKSAPKPAPLVTEPVKESSWTEGKVTLLAMGMGAFVTVAVAVTVLVVFPLFPAIIPVMSLLAKGLSIGGGAILGAGIGKLLYNNFTFPKKANPESEGTNRHSSSPSSSSSEDEAFFNSAENGDRATNDKGRVARQNEVRQPVVTENGIEFVDVESEDDDRPLTTDEDPLNFYRGNRAQFNRRTERHNQINQAADRLNEAAGTAPPRRLSDKAVRVLTNIAIGAGIAVVLGVGFIAIPILLGGAMPLAMALALGGGSAFIGGLIGWIRYSEGPADAPRDQVISDIAEEVLDEANPAVREEVSERMIEAHLLYRNIEGLQRDIRKLEANIDLVDNRIYLFTQLRERFLQKEIAQHGLMPGDGTVASMREALNGIFTHKDKLSGFDQMIKRIELERATLVTVLERQKSLLAEQEAQVGPFRDQGIPMPVDVDPLANMSQEELEDEIEKLQQRIDAERSSLEESRKLHQDFLNDDIAFLGSYVGHFDLMDKAFAAIGIKVRNISKLTEEIEALRERAVQRAEERDRALDLQSRIDQLNRQSQEPQSQLKRDQDVLECLTHQKQKLMAALVTEYRLPVTITEDALLAQMVGSQRHDIIAKVTALNKAIELAKGRIAQYNQIVERQKADLQALEAEALPFRERGIIAFPVEVNPFLRKNRQEIEAEIQEIQALLNRNTEELDAMLEEYYKVEAVQIQSERVGDHTGYFARLGDLFVKIREKRVIAKELQEKISTGGSLLSGMLSAERRPEEREVPRVRESAPIRAELPRWEPKRLHASQEESFAEYARHVGQLSNENRTLVQLETLILAGRSLGYPEETLAGMYKSIAAAMSVRKHEMDRLRTSLLGIKLPEVSFKETVFPGLKEAIRLSIGRHASAEERRIATAVYLRSQESFLVEREAILTKEKHALERQIALKQRTLNQMPGGKKRVNGWIAELKKVDAYLIETRKFLTQVGQVLAKRVETWKSDLGSGYLAMERKIVNSMVQVSSGVLLDIPAREMDAGSDAGDEDDLPLWNSRSEFPPSPRSPSRFSERRDRFSERRDSTSSLVFFNPKERPMGMHRIDGLTDSESDDEFSSPDRDRLPQPPASKSASPGFSQDLHRFRPWN